MFRAPHPSSIDEPYFPPYNRGNRRRNNNNANAPNKKEEIPKWFCPSCGENLRMTLSECFICETPRPAVILDAATVYERKVQRVHEQWTCFKCADSGKKAINFGKERRCAFCKTVRPTPEEVRQREQLEKEKEVKRRQELEMKRLEKEKMEKDLIYVWQVAGWDKLRLLFLGSQNISSVFSLLPSSVLRQIIQYLIYTPHSSASIILNYFELLPNAEIKIATSVFDHDYYDDSEEGWLLTTENHSIKFSLYSWTRNATYQITRPHSIVTRAQFRFWWNSPQNSLSERPKQQILEKCVMREAYINVRGYSNVTLPSFQ